MPQDPSSHPPSSSLAHLYDPMSTSGKSPVASIEKGAKAANESITEETKATVQELVDENGQCRRLT